MVRCFGEPSDAREHHPARCHQGVTARVVVLHGVQQAIEQRNPFHGIDPAELTPQGDVDLEEKTRALGIARLKFSELINSPAVAFSTPPGTGCSAACARASAPRLESVVG